MTGLDLRDQERYWQYVRESWPHDYHGIAVHPRHLSMYERVVLKRHQNYDPKLDKDAKIEELRALYKAIVGEKSKEDVGPAVQDAFRDEVSAYFEWEKSRNDSVTTVTWMFWTFVG